MKIIKKLILIIFILTLIKSLLSLIVSMPTIYSDEYVYLKIAQSFFLNSRLDLHTLSTNSYPPLYPILISISYLFKDAQIAYLIAKILNSLLSSLIIIPAYLLSKEFVDSKKALLISFIVSILPMNFAFAAFIMSENLFYTLFLFSLYFIYKSFTENNYKYDIASGICIGLSFLTKFSAISLVFIVIALFVYKLFKKEFFEIKNKVIMGLSALLIIAPWIIRNILVFGFTLKGITGQYAGEISAKSVYYSQNLVIWFCIYFAYILITSLFLILILNFSTLKLKLSDKRFQILTLIALLTLVIIIFGAAQHAAKSNIKLITDIQNLSGRPIGRYVDTALPILFIAGLITFFRFKENEKTIKRLLLISMPFVVLSSQLIYFNLFPANNLSLTLIGILNVILTKLLTLKLSMILITLGLLASCVTLILKRHSMRNLKLIPIIIVFCLLTNITSFAATSYNSSTWKDNPQIKLSLWIKENIKNNSTILIDSDYCGNFNKQNYDILCPAGKSTVLTALWLTNSIIIDNLNTTNKYDYILTKKQLSLDIIAQTENNIYVYQIN